MNKVWIVVLNWNNWKHTSECLSSLQALQCEPFRIIMVDNGSTDDSVNRVRESFADVEIIELKRNLGFAQGNNAGIRVALDCRADYVWLLNNDTRVDPMALHALVEKAESDYRIGAVGSAIYSMSNAERLQTWGGGKVNFWLARSRPFPARVADRKIQFLTAASMLVRRSVLESVGLLDEGYFMYWEDVDYCFRIRAAGWRLAVAGASRVWHQEGGTARKNRANLEMNSSRSAMRFFRKHAPLPAFSLSVGLIFRLGKRAIKGDWEGLGASWHGATKGHTQPVTRTP